MSIYPAIIAQEQEKMHLSKHGIGTILDNKSNDD